MDNFSDNFVDNCQDLVVVNFGQFWDNLLEILGHYVWVNFEVNFGDDFLRQHLGQFFVQYNSTLFPVIW